MRDDVEYLDDESHDFISLGKDLITQIPYKKAFLLAIVMVFVMSSSFINSILANVQGAVVMDNTTTKGTLIQITIITIAYIFIDMIIDAKWI